MTVPSRALPAAPAAAEALGGEDLYGVAEHSHGARRDGCCGLIGRRSPACSF